ncbi:MAG: hypothetical protein Q7N87_02890 [Candidatus Uhrbacteria bacterium]|nr:hypothetical protein [Candidatus Uhrbacteria bacterium]
MTHKLFTYYPLLAQRLMTVVFTATFGLLSFGFGLPVKAANVPLRGFVIPPLVMNNLPKINPATHTVDATAYTSSVEECDSDPFITADGSTTHDGIIAANFLPFNTKVKIPELFGDKIFEVHDRMNSKYNDRSKYRPRIDVWMEKKVDMRQFGYKPMIKIEIVEMGDGKTQWNKRALAMRKESGMKN